MLIPVTTGQFHHLVSPVTAYTVHFCHHCTKHQNCHGLFQWMCSAMITETCCMVLLCRMLLNNSPMKVPSPEPDSEPALVTMAQVLYFSVKMGVFGNSSLSPCAVNGSSSALIVRILPTFFLRPHTNSCTLLPT